MANIKQINIKNRANYFFNDMINIKKYAKSPIKIIQKYWYLLYRIHHNKKN